MMRLQVAKRRELVVRQFWAGFRRRLVSLLAPLALPVGEMGRPGAPAQLVLPEGLGARAPAQLLLGQPGLRPSRRGRCVALPDNTLYHHRGR